MVATAYRQLSLYHKCGLEVNVTRLLEMYCYHRRTACADHHPDKQTCTAICFGWHNGVDHINKVKLGRDRLVLRLVTTFGGSTVPGIFQAHSAWPSPRG